MMREQLSPDVEGLERAIDHELAGLLSSADIAGQGKDATVFRIEADKVPSRLVDDLRRLGENAEAPDTVAMKMLKVYEPGMAQQELRIHSRAWKVMQEVADDGSFAQVPRVYFVHTAHFTPEEQGQFARLGYSVGASADIILMDFVPGSDLKKIISARVGELGQDAPQHLREKTLDPDSDYAYTFLQKRGFSFHEAVASRIERTMKRFHAHRIYHRDLHEANVMIDGDPASPDAIVHIIDFGRSGDVQDNELNQPVEEGEFKPIDDMMLVRRIRSHVQERPGEPSEDERSWYEDLERYRRLAPNHSLLKQFSEKLVVNRRRAFDGFSAMTERDLSQAAVQILGALDADLITPDEAIDVVRRMREQAKLLSLQRKIGWMLKFLETRLGS